MTTVREVAALLDRRFPPELAQAWDAVGLSVGDPDAAIDAVWFAVDPTLAVVDEALAGGAGLLVTHHPLLLRGVTSVAADTPKGAAVHRLITGGCALYTAHTNADAAVGGVADALADALGLVDRSPLVPDAADPELGIGRVGALARPTTVGDFARDVARALPATEHGVRVAGDLRAPVATVAVLGGSGDSLMDAVRAADVDAYVTADLRHHAASEFREWAALRGGRPALVDVSHFASEWLWLAAAASDLARDTGVACTVSTLVTDPWTARFGADPSP